MIVRGSDLHETRCEYGNDAELLPQRDLQLPDARYRQAKDREVGHDVEYPRGLDARVRVEAVTRRHQRIPDPRSRNALEDVDHGLEKVEDEDEPDPGLDADVQEHVPLPGRAEDAEVLEEDRELDQEDDGAVDDRDEVDPLHLS